VRQSGRAHVSDTGRCSQTSESTPLSGCSED
jgi:hypothetical protein